MRDFFGLLADTISAKYWKQHVTGIWLPIWDLSNSQINKDIYIRHSAVGYGEAIVNHLLHNLKTLSFPYKRKYLIGIAMGKQYVYIFEGR